MPFCCIVKINYSPHIEAGESGSFSQEQECVVIRKYANRRLYDTKQSKYVTLEELADHIRKGTRYEVRDAATGEDLTRSVLTQIILGEGTKGKNVLPESFLHNIVAMCGNQSQQLLPQYLELAMDSFKHQQDAWHGVINNGINNGSDHSNSAPSSNGNAKVHNEGHHFPSINGLPNVYELMKKQADQNSNIFSQWLGAFSGSGGNGAMPNMFAAAKMQPEASSGQYQNSTTKEEGNEQASNSSGGNHISESEKLALLQSQVQNLQQQIQNMAKLMQGNNSEDKIPHSAAKKTSKSEAVIRKNDKNTANGLDKLQ